MRSVETSKRKIPTKHKIKEYWKHRIVEMKKDIFNSIDHLERGDFCFACGLLTNNHTERAHIIARVSGGTDNVDNLHLLCSICHKDSELFEGDRYFEWFKNRNHVDAIMSILYKYDYRLFKTFIEEAEKNSIDIYSISFLNSFNALRRTSF